jgi:hypothetical protein
MEVQPVHVHERFSVGQRVTTTGRLGNRFGTVRSAATDPRFPRVQVVSVEWDDEQRTTHDAENLQPVSTWLALSRMVPMLVLFLLLSAGSAFAQQTTDPRVPLTVISYTDAELSHPCGTGVKGSASPVIIKDVLHVVFTCNDDQIIVRKYETVDPVLTPPSAIPCAHLPGYIPGPNNVGCIPPPTPYVLPVPPPVPVNSCAHIPGFVEGVGGGCVPPDHPLAKK